MPTVRSASERRLYPPSHCIAADEIVRQKPAGIVEIAERNVAGLNLTSPGQVAELIVGEAAERATQRVKAVAECPPRTL